MIISNKDELKPCKGNIFYNLDTVYGSIPMDIRLHMQRVAGYGEILSKYIKRNHLFFNSADNDFYENANIIFQLHDIGYGLLEEQNNIVEELDKYSMAKQAEHTMNSRKILENIIFAEFSESTFKYIKDAAMYHHERYDGNGVYGIKGDEIPFSARMCAIADAYDLLALKEPHSKLEGNDKIIDRITDGAGSYFQPELVDALIECAEEFNKLDLENGNSKLK